MVAASRPLVHPGVGNWRALVERLLPWYEPALERLRDARSASRTRRTDAAIERSQRVIAAYREATVEAATATATATKAGEAVVDEVERANEDAVADEVERAGDTP